MMSAEQWKPIPGYEGRYEASTQGRIRSLIYWSGKGHRYVKRKTPKILKQNMGSRGYYRVTLSKCDKERSQKVLPVHRLIALTWIPNPNNYPEVMHIDETRTNNKVSNLEWGTSKMNCNAPLRKQRLSKSHKNVITNEIKEQISESLKEWYKKGNVPHNARAISFDGRVYKSIAECARSECVDYNKLKSALNGYGKMPDEWIQKDVRYVQEIQ